MPDKDPRYLTPEEERRIKAKFYSMVDDASDERDCLTLDKSILPWLLMLNEIPGVCTISSCGHEGNGHIMLWTTESAVEVFRQTVFDFMDTMKRFTRPTMNSRYQHSGQEYIMVQWWTGTLDDERRQTSMTALVGYMKLLVATPDHMQEFQKKWGINDA